MVNLAVATGRVDEVEASASEPGGRDVVRAVGFMAAELAVTVVVDTDSGPASC